MLLYTKFKDAQGRVGRSLTLFGKRIFETLENPIDQVNPISGIDLSWYDLTIFEDVGGGFPKMRHYPVGQLLVGERKKQEIEIPSARRHFSRLGEEYEIRIYDRVSYYDRLYRWFGLELDRRRVYRAFGEDCAEFTFALPAWEVRIPTNFEIVNQSKKIKLEVEAIGCP